MKRQGGFTLIELVVVIVILGILAVTAAPRFLNIQDDARIATLEGLAGAMQGAAGIVYGKSAIEGTEAVSSSSVTMSGDTINTAFGYPKATNADLSAIVTGLGAGEDFQHIKAYTVASAAASSFGIPSYATNCVQYLEATGANTAAVVSVISGDNCTN
ncbi:type II secretion system protein [Vibrio brasiliensis]|uniref:type II secretion system protein n=1 Tax=Vibrio brasiliensis TaxID=170652 RepID=UPI001EFD9F0F|nr:type II secretion system protein [Vibrio brasiliensis]MCG9727819.1 type II secretion system GspH family protein [Vibrio brasiliensis]